MGADNASPGAAVEKEDTVEHIHGETNEEKVPSSDNDLGYDGSDSRSDTSDDPRSGIDPLDHDNDQDSTRPEQLRRISSTFTRATSVIPRARRRGLFGSLAIIPEVESPYEYKNSTKWCITAIVALAAAAAPMGSGIFYPALPELSRDLDASPTITNLSVAMYMLAMSIFPLWWSAFSETLGRRTIYIASFTLFVIFSIVSAVSVNITMLIVMRVLGGGASASVQAVGAGTIADIWEPKDRGRAMGFFYLGPLIGPLFSPIIGGALSQGFGWRATMWFLAIYGGVTLLLIIFCLPETLVKRKPSPPVVVVVVVGDGDGDGSNALRRVSTVQSAKNKTKSFLHKLKSFFIDPLRVLLYLRFPPVIVTVYSASIAFGSLFVLNISIQASFDKAPYDFPMIPVGLLYIAPSVGYVVASLFGGRWIDRIMAREAQKAGRYDATGKLIFLPEDRMNENMWLAATMYPGAMIWYGWTVEKGLPWIVPSIANFFFGCGSMLVFGAVTTMLTEFMPNRSSSGVAVNNFVRNIFSCVGAIVAQPLISALGNGWVCTMIGLFAWVTGNAAIWLLKRNGPKWRISMDETLRREHQ
ncbi:major facilitator superfamily domain-containing protein [Podospora appendiculata]|uniref:Major facilitator superfamily domain-containing protein n=1 Tax=Podospora appendiculata TaxID=314037 RepID=A0AAE0X5R6_9PEZI|nr:major facilitator superfamily domain-containing protein [Podospora appendiculata]